MITLDIFFDPICPWCYLGKAQLDAAEAKAGAIFTRRWRPFFLNPEMPSKGMDRRTYLAAKFGDEESAGAAYAPIPQIAQDLNLPLALDKITRTPNTLDAHRLALWAETEDCQESVVTALFRAYFVSGRDISDPEVLCDLADGAGLDGALTARLLASDADCAEIYNRDAVARDMGVTGVPTFVVAGQHAVPGMQEAALWEQVIGEIRGG